MRAIMVDIPISMFFFISLFILMFSLIHTEINDFSKFEIEKYSSLLYRLSDNKESIAVIRRDNVFINTSKVKIKIFKNIIDIFANEKLYMEICVHPGNIKDIFANGCSFSLLDNCVSISCNNNGNITIISDEFDLLEIKRINYCKKIVGEIYLCSLPKEVVKIEGDNLIITKILKIR